jgi:segregation and condensation protein A
MYKIKNEQFEGPLDLLLSLIEKEQLDITQISLAQITSSYLSMIAEIEGDSSELADFLVVAAKLLYIKSKNLIPSVTTEEEEAEIDDLEARLREYSQYKEAARHLETVLATETRSYARRAANEKVACFTPPKDLDGNTLFAIFQEVLERVEKEDKPATSEMKQEPKVTLEEKRASILVHLKKGKSVSFRHILGQAKSKTEVIVTFLAILEMVKQKEVRVEQSGNFTDFTLISASPSSLA